MSEIFQALVVWANLGLGIGLTRDGRPFAAAWCFCCAAGVAYMLTGGDL